MKFGTQTVLAIGAALFSTTTLAGPLAVNALSPRSSPPKMTASDRYVVSGQNYTTWSNNMVTQGMMHWPDTPSSKQIKARTTSWSVNSVACGFIGGTSSSYEIGEAKFCAFVRDFFVRDYVGLTLTGVSFPPQDGLCDDNQDCTMIIDLAFGIGGSFVKDAIPAFCEDIFEAVWNDCSGSGGSAELTVGSETGIVQAQFFVRDEGATCPANTPTNVCKAWTF